MITVEQMNEWRAAHEGTSPGRWLLCEKSPVWTVCVAAGDAPECAATIAYEVREGDGRFMVAAHVAVPALLDVVAGQTTELHISLGEVRGLRARLSIAAQFLRELAENGVSGLDRAGARQALEQIGEAPHVQ